MCGVDWGEREEAVESMSIYFQTRAIVAGLEKARRRILKVICFNCNPEQKMPASAVLTFA